MVDLVKRRRNIITLVLMVLACAVLFTACNEASVEIANNVATQPTNFIMRFIKVLYDSMGIGLGWTVVIFTLILKVALSPLDFWQKHVTRRNAKAMERMKPQLEKLQKQYGSNKEIYNQKQMALYKKEKYSMFGACLPTIVTLVVFILVFTGFRQFVAFKNAEAYTEARAIYNVTQETVYGTEYNQIFASVEAAEVYTNAYNSTAAQQIYDDTYASKLAEYEADGDADAVANATADAEAARITYANGLKVLYARISAEDLAEKAAQKAVAAEYEIEGFLWVKNVFVPDAWNKAVPDYSAFIGKSGIGNGTVSGVDRAEYEQTMKEVLGSSGYGSGGSWNGLLLFPVICIALTFLTQKLTSKQQQKSQPPQAEGGMGAATGQSMKIMQYIMPVMMGVFVVLYSTAFATYILTSSLFSLVFQLVFMMIFGRKDKQDEEVALATTYKSVRAKNAQVDATPDSKLVRSKAEVQAEKTAQKAEKQKAKNKKKDENKKKVNNFLN